MRRVQFFALLLVFGVVGVLPDTGVGPSTPHVDKVLHVAGWILGGVSGRYAYPRARGLLLGAGLWTYSLLIETIQIFVPTRSFEINDLVANAVGVAIGLMAMRYVLRPAQNR